MPLYDYRCRKCGEIFEVRRKFSDAPLTEHEGCGGEVDQMLSAPALQFKGTGWYVTDYARAGKSGASNGKSESKSESKSEGAKTETKSETKSEPAKPSTPAKTDK